MRPTNEIVSENLTRLLRGSGKTQAELARFCGVAGPSAYAWFHGSMPKAPAIDRICQFFGITQADLLIDHEILTDKHLNARSIPVYSSVAAGAGFFADENVTDYVSIDRGVRADFAVRVRGDSMTGAGIYDGDLVTCVKPYEHYRDGLIYIVYQIGEGLAYVKRVFRSGTQIVLMSENPKYAPLFFDATDIVIEGEVTGVWHSMEQRNG
jgi:repressor LexA